MTRHDHEGLDSLDILETKVDRGHTESSCGHRKFDEHLVGSQMDTQVDQGREGLCSSPNHENFLVVRHFVNVCGCGRIMKELRRL